MNAYPEIEPASAPFVAEPLPQWQLQEAKNRFSAVVKAAQDQAQVVTVHGQAAAVVLSPKRYAALMQGQAPRDLLSQALACPVLDDEDSQVFARDTSANPARELSF
jgi:prevent-host-death family protein